MRSLHRPSLLSLLALLAICLALPAAAQDRPPADDAREPNAAFLNAPAVLTGKERLGMVSLAEQLQRADQVSWLATVLVGGVERKVELRLAIIGERVTGRYGKPGNVVIDCMVS